MHDFDVFNECVTDRPTDRQTDRATDTAYYRDARTHLKNKGKESLLFMLYFVMQQGSVVHWRVSEGPTLATILVSYGRGETQFQDV